MNKKYQRDLNSVNRSMKVDGIYSRKVFNSFRSERKQCLAMIHLGVKRNNVSDLSDSYTAETMFRKRKEKEKEEKRKGERGSVSFPFAAIKSGTYVLLLPWRQFSENFCAYMRVVVRDMPAYGEPGVEKIISLSRLFASHDSHLNLG